MPGVCERCPSCGAGIALSDAYCLTCGASRGVLAPTPREDYLRACVSSLELLRQTSRCVRPLAETTQAEGLIERAISLIRAGIAL
jgi:hypothetical protein